MKPKELFGVAVRVIGLLSVIFGAYSILLGLWVGIQSHNGGSSILFFPGIVYLCVGFFLMRGSSVIEKYVYPDDE